MVGESTIAVDGRLRKSPWTAFGALACFFTAALSCAPRGDHESSSSTGGLPRPVGAAGPTTPTSVPVEWAGCAAIGVGPVCQLGRERKLTLWIPDAAGSSWSVTIDERPGRAVREAGVDGGTRITLDVPQGTRRLTLSGAGGEARWALSLAEAPAHEDIDRLVTLGRTGKYQEALVGLQALQDHHVPAERGPIEAAIGRMTLALGHVDLSEPHFRSAMAAAKAEGRLSDVVKDGAGLLWALVHVQQRYADARAILREMAAAGQQTSEGRVWLDFHAGLLAADTADIRTAMESYRRAGRAARRIGLTGMAESADIEVARLLTRIGRPGDALALLKAFAPPKDSCARATRALDVVWARIEQEAIDASVEGRSERARAIAEVDRATRDCPDPHRRMMALTYAAEGALQDHDQPGARPFIDELELTADDHDALHSSRRAEVLGRWYLQQGKPLAALASFDKELPAARERGLLEEIFRSEVGAGRALLKLGRRQAAVTRLQAAQSLLQTMLRGVPLGEGRGGFLSGRDEGIRYLVGALVDGGAIDQALRTVRLARSAELTFAARLDRLSHLSSDQRRSWDDALGRYQGLRAAIEQDAERDWSVPRLELAQRRAGRLVQTEQARAALDDAYALLTDSKELDEARLSEPKPGEFFLGCFRGVAEWFAFGYSATAVRVRRVPAAAFASPGSAEKVLALFDAQLASAKRIRLLLHGAADRVDWQGVRWRGQPLLASMQVEYGMDLGTAATSHGEHREDANALVVSNPTGDLGAAASEADAVVAALKGWHVVRLDGEAVSRNALLAALPTTTLFHYAGHAQISLSDGLSSALLLSANARVELGDLLAAPAVPQLVVLPACAAAGTLEGGRSQMGLAQAFLAAGARVAIAPIRPVGDTEAARFVGAFYSALARAIGSRTNASGFAPLKDTVEFSRRAFRDAALAVSVERRDFTAPEHQQDNGSDSFRLLVP